MLYMVLDLLYMVLDLLYIYRNIRYLFIKLSFHCFNGNLDSRVWVFHTKLKRTQF